MDRHHCACSHPLPEIRHRQTGQAAQNCPLWHAPAAVAISGLVRDGLVAYASPGGVTMPGAAWLVTAHAA
jgi:hypothetical protein